MFCFFNVVNILFSIIVLKITRKCFTKTFPFRFQLVCLEVVFYFVVITYLIIRNVLTFVLNSLGGVLVVIMLTFVFISVLLYFRTFIFLFIKWFQNKWDFITVEVIWWQSFNWKIRLTFRSYSFNKHNIQILWYNIIIHIHSNNIQFNKLQNLTLCQFL